MFFQKQASASQVSAWTKVGSTPARLLMATKRTQTQTLHTNATEGVCRALVSLGHPDHAPRSAITSEGCLEVRQMCLTLASESGERIEPGESNKLQAGIILSSLHLHNKKRATRPLRTLHHKMFHAPRSSLQIMSRLTCT